MDDKRGIITNTAYSIGGALVLNGVLQLFIYPALNRVMGQTLMGNVIFIMGLVNILGPAVGQALNNSRLVVRRERDVKNGDYNTMLLLFSAIGSVVVLILSASEAGGVFGLILLTVLNFLTVFRFYGDVEYRMSLKYRDYFLYYAAASAGYIIGYFLYRLSGNWYIIFIAGELCAAAFVAARGSIYRNFLERSVYFNEAFIKGSTLVLSYFLTNLTLNVDKIALKYLIDADAVTVYYVTSLIGKTLVLLIAPVNTIIISYLTRGTKRIGRKQYHMFVLAGIAVSFVFFLLCQIGTPLFIRIFYPELAAAAAPVVTVVNISQILSMLSAYLFIVVLTFTGAKWQLILQGIHLVLLIVLVILFTPRGGLPGFSTAVLAANAVRIVLVLLLGEKKILTNDI